MYHVILQFFGGDPHVPKPCQSNGLTMAHAFWNIDRNCHETAPIPAEEYEAFYRKLPDKWRVVVLVGELPVKAHPNPDPLDDGPEPAVTAEPPTDGARQAETEELPVKLRHRELRALAKKRGISIATNITTEELRALVELPAPSP